MRRPPPPPPRKNGTHEHHGDSQPAGQRAEMPAPPHKDNHFLQMEVVIPHLLCTSSKLEFDCSLFQQQCTAERATIGGKFKSRAGVRESLTGKNEGARARLVAASVVISSIYPVMSANVKTVAPDRQRSRSFSVHVVQKAQVTSKPGLGCMVVCCMQVGWFLKADSLLRLRLLRIINHYWHCICTTFISQYCSSQFTIGWAISPRT